MTKMLSTVAILALAANSVFADAALDTTFGTGGSVLTDFSGDRDLAHAMAIDGSNNIVSTGEIKVGGQMMIGLSRHDANGVLDAGFGTGGLVTTAPGVKLDKAYAVKILASGKILVAGQTHDGSDHDIVLIRYNSNGTVDGTFGTAGIVRTPVGSRGDFARDMLVDSSDRIVVAGYYLSDTAGYDFVVARYDAAGTLDPTFGTSGLVKISPTSNNDLAYALAMQSDGKIIVVGESQNATSDMAWAHLDANGGLISTGSFDSGNSDVVRSVMVLSDDSIVLGGKNDGDAAVVKLNSAAVLDATFGVNGVRLVDTGSSLEEFYALGLQDGDIVAAGYTANATNDLLLARMSTSGSLDTAFGPGGYVMTDINGEADFGRSMKVAGSSILVAGNSYNGTDMDFLLAKYKTEYIVDITTNVGRVKFGTVACGSSSTKLISVQNIGNAAVDITPTRLLV